MWCGAYQLGRSEDASGANGQSEAQSGRERESVGRHCFGDLVVEYRARRNESGGVLKVGLVVEKIERMIEEQAPRKTEERMTVRDSVVEWMMEKRIWHRNPRPLCSFRDPRIRGAIVGRAKGQTGTRTLQG